jgi:hypothetical protein
MIYSLIYELRILYSIHHDDIAIFLPAKVWFPALLSRVDLRPQKVWRSDHMSRDVQRRWWINGKYNMNVITSLGVRSFFCMATRDVTDFILGILRDVKTHCTFESHEQFEIPMRREFAASYRKTWSISINILLLARIAPKFSVLDKPSHLQGVLESFSMARQNRAEMTRI